MPNLPRMVLVSILVVLLSAPGGEAATPLLATIFASIPFGDDEGAIPTFQLGQQGEGVPTAFTFGPDGKLYVLVPHSRTILVYGPGGAHESTVKLTTKDGGPLPDEAFLYDLSLDNAGRYLVLDQAGGWIARFGADGKVVDTFGANVGAQSFAVAPDGNVVVRDAAESVLNLFDPAGAFLGELRGPYLAPETNRDGEFVRSRIVGFHRAFVWLRRAGGGLPRLFAVMNPIGTDAKLYQADSLGFDDRNKLHVVTTEKEGENTYHSYLHRFAAGDSAVEVVYRIEPNMERVSTIPRFHRLEPDGRVVTFKLTPQAYQVLVYKTR